MDKDETIINKGMVMNKHPISVTKNRQVAERIGFCGMIGMWVLSMKNHKIKCEQLKFYAEVRG